LIPIRQGGGRRSTIFRGEGKRRVSFSKRKKAGRGIVSIFSPREGGEELRLLSRKKGRRARGGEQNQYLLAIWGGGEGGDEESSSLGDEKKGKGERDRREGPESAFF